MLDTSRPLARFTCPAGLSLPSPPRLLSPEVSFKHSSLLYLPVLLAPSGPRQAGALQPTKTSSLWTPNPSSRPSRPRCPPYPARIPTHGRDAVCLHSLHALKRSRSCTRQAGSPTLSRCPAPTHHAHAPAPAAARGWRRSQRPRPGRRHLLRVCSAVRWSHGVFLVGCRLCSPG